MGMDTADYFASPEPPGVDFEQMDYPRCLMPLTLHHYERRRDDSSLVSTEEGLCS